MPRPVVSKLPCDSAAPCSSRSQSPGSDVAEQLHCSRARRTSSCNNAAARLDSRASPVRRCAWTESIWLAFYRRNFECGSTNRTGLTTPRFTSAKRTARARESASPPGAPTKPQPKLLQGGGNETPPIRPSRARRTVTLQAGAYTARRTPHGASWKRAQARAIRLRFTHSKRAAALREIGAHFAVAEPRCERDRRTSAAPERSGRNDAKRVAW